MNNEQTINSLAECSVSLKRVQNFLLAEEIEKPSRNNRERVGVTVSHGDFYWNEVGLYGGLNSRVRYRIINKNRRRDVGEIAQK